MRGFSTLYCLVFLTFYSLAQDSTQCSYKLTGQLIDGECNGAFMGASVYLVELKKAVTTNEFGEFEFPNLCKGKYTLRYSFLGYKTFEAVYNIKKNTSDKVILHTDTCELNSITIYGLKSEQLASFTKTILNEKDIQRSSGLSLGETLKEINGVSLYQTGPSIVKPIIHGLHSNRILIVNNGIRQEGQQWGKEHAPEIDPFTANKITVIKGAAGVKYGSDAVAGIILVEPKEFKKTPGLEGELNIAGFSNNRMGVVSGNLDGNFNKIPALSWRIQGTLKKAGDASAPNYILSNTAFEERNFTYALAYHKQKWGLDLFYSQFNTKLGILMSSHTGSLSDLSNAIKRDRPVDIFPFSYEIRRPNQNVEHELIKANIYRNIGFWGKISLTAGYQFNRRKEYDRHKPLTNEWKELPQLQLNLTTYSIDLKLEHEPLWGLKGEVGVQNSFQENTYSGRFLIPFYNSYQSGIYWIEKWRKRRIELEAGLRFDVKHYASIDEKNSFKTNYLNFQSPSAMVGVNYYLSEKTIWKNSIGNTFRPPTINEIYSNGLHHGSSAFIYGNSEIKPEKAYKIVSTLEYKSPKLSTELSLHYNYINDYIFSNPIFPPIQTIRGAFPAFRYTQANVNFYGFDGLVNYALVSDLQAIAKISTVNAWNYSSNDYLIFIPPYRFSTTLNYAPTWAYFLRKHQVYALLSAEYTAKQTRVPTKNDGIINLPGTDSAIEIIGGDYKASPEAYTLVNTEIGADFIWGKQHFIMSIQANNLLNESYRNYMNQFRYFADEPGRNIALRIKIPFS